MNGTLLAGRGGEFGGGGARARGSGAGTSRTALSVAEAAADTAARPSVLPPAQTKHYSLLI